MSRWLPIMISVYLAFTSVGCTKSARLGRRCRGGNGAACTELAGRLALGRGAARNPARAAQLFRDAARAYEKGCGSGDAAACLALGEAHETASGVSQDSGAAALFYEKACNGGNAAGCQKLASIGPSAASIPLLQKACDGNSASACQQLGLMYSMGRTDEDRASAAVYLRKACDAGHSDGCDMLADALDSGRGLPEDSSRASRLHQRAGFAALQSTDTDVRGCRDGQLAACVAFANLCLQPGGPPNWMRTHPHEEEQLETEALHVLDDLCAAEYWTGCTRLALFFSWSREPFPPRDASKATALYQRACDGGLWTACRDLASLYESGPGMPHDVEKAVQLHQRACDHGLQDSCSSVESLTRRPEPAPPVETDRFEPTQDGF